MCIDGCSLWFWKVGELVLVLMWKSRVMLGWLLLLLLFCICYFRFSEGLVLLLIVCLVLVLCWCSRLLVFSCSF